LDYFLDFENPNPNSLNCI